MSDEGGPHQATHLHLFPGLPRVRDLDEFGQGQVGAVRCRGMIGVVRSSCRQRS